MIKTIIEPFKIKSVEPISINSYEERKDILLKADYISLRLILKM